LLSQGHTIEPFPQVSQRRDWTAVRETVE
jgi:hypothetical protein